MDYKKELEHNFESAEAFSRAFKTLYKVSPNEYRKQRMQTFISHKPYLDETHVTHLLKHVNVHPKIVEIDDILVGGFRAEVSLRQKELKELWESFYDLLSMLSITHKKRRKFGVYEAFDEQMHYYIHEDMESHEVFGLEVFPDDELPDYFIRKQVKKGRYAVFTHHGSMRTLQRTIDYIWKTWILNTKEVHDAREPFELYDERFLGYNHPDSEIDIYIAIL